MSAPAVTAAFSCLLLCALLLALPGPGALVLLGWNLAALLAFAWDKGQAQAGGHRIPESALHWWAVLGGCAGASTGRAIFRHKTQRLAFTLTSLLGCLSYLTLLSVI